MTAPARPRTAGHPTTTDLALLIRQLDDLQNWSPAAQVIAEQARAAADQVLREGGWDDEELRDCHREVRVPCDWEHSYALGGRAA